VSSTERRWTANAAYCRAIAAVAAVGLATAHLAILAATWGRTPTVHGEGNVYNISFEMWIFQWLGLVLLGAGLLAGALFLTDPARRRRASDEIGAPGNMPDPPGINISRVRIGGDAAGLLIVVGIIIAFMPMLWGWFLAVAAGSVVVAVGLFLWHRYHPW
jgi:hypothetical protein